MPTTMSTPAVVSSKDLTGGRLRLAVPNSSAMLIVGPRCAWPARQVGSGVGGGTGAVWGLDQVMIRSRL